VHDAMAEAVDRARAGGGPTVVEALTYRHYGHSRTDPGKYRPEAEVAEWMARDPLVVARQRLLDLGSSQAEVDAVDERAAETVAAASRAAQDAPAADPAEAFTDVWADGGWAWRT
jgi:TPP-dependent pyruvate/acetoin dehydrogenase alpha subunit